MIIGELEPGEDGYEGISEDEQWHVFAPYDVLAEAHHILIMRGISSHRHNAILYDTEIWVHDATLRGLEGVTIEPVDESPTL